MLPHIWQYFEIKNTSELIYEHGNPNVTVYLV